MTEWSLRFQREFNDWELVASYSFLHFIQTRIPKGGGCDKLCWDLNGSGKFDTQSFYHKIRNVAPSTFPWKGIWKVKVPKRVTFFIFFLISNKDSLIAKGRGTQVHRKYTGMNKSRTEITKVKKIQKRKRLVSPHRELVK